MGTDYFLLLARPMTAYGIGLDVASCILRDVRYSTWVRALPKPALYRIQTILAALINGDPVTARRMASVLEVSARTIARDIDYLINSLHVPISYDAKQHTYILKGPVPVLFAPHAGAPAAPHYPTPEALVTMELDADLVLHFESVELHPSQRLEKQTDGTALLYLTVPPNDALAQWVLSYGGRIRVKDPLPLRSRVYALAMHVLNAHQPSN